LKYTLVIERRAQKALARIEQRDRARIADAIRGLALDPRPRGVKKLTGRDAYRLRGGISDLVRDRGRSACRPRCGRGTSARNLSPLMRFWTTGNLRPRREAERWLKVLLRRTRGFEPVSDHGRCGRSVSASPEGRDPPRRPRKKWGRTTNFPRFGTVLPAKTSSFPQSPTWRRAASNCSCATPRCLKASISCSFLLQPSRASSRRNPSLT